MSKNIPSQPELSMFGTQNAPNILKELLMIGSEIRVDKETQ